MKGWKRPGPLHSAIVTKIDGILWANAGKSLKVGIEKTMH